MKESKKCKIISLTCVFLAVVSLAMVGIAASKESLVFVVWNTANMIAASVLGVAFWNRSKDWRRLGD